MTDKTHYQKWREYEAAKVDPPRGQAVHGDVIYKWNIDKTDVVVFTVEGSPYYVPYMPIEVVQTFFDQMIEKGVIKRVGK